MSQQVQRGVRAWLPWSGDRAVEYQIEDDFLRIKRWQGGQTRISDWAVWEHSTDVTVRKLIRELDWDDLPKHASQAAQPEPPATRRRLLLSWVRDHFVRG
jgi:hypothetical protein